MGKRLMNRAAAGLSIVTAVIVLWGGVADAHPDNCLVWAQWPVHTHLVCS